ncbi:leucine-rich repeat-containing protein 14B isoform X3 [Cynoglossus semilaevis]|uniref:Protein naked cuticle homolog n=1 Tax=Cynoglossus semilaevis TaxID=244447 RepID=A0A3P8WR66_CYNSE|nr:protein naked cuticle homolog 2-like isoform X3 [Cynoglossus semilaevis]
MGKLQSKLAVKRRQSPEGDSLASNVMTGQKEHETSMKTQLTENLCVELKKNKSDHICNLQVILPPKKTTVWDKNIQVDKETRKKESLDTKWDVALEDHSQQEWTFTFSNVNKPSQVTNKDAPLKIKLAVCPSVCQEKILLQAEKDQESASPVRKLYCADENIERRNHYLDLAGIENYASKFDNMETQEQTQSVLQHHKVAEKRRCTSFRSPRSAGRDSSRAVERSCRLQVHHPASWCHPARCRPLAPGVLPLTHSKRSRSRTQDAHTLVRDPSFKLQPRDDRNMLDKHHALCRPPVAQQHEHYHHHEHHHHHHHHHYHPS